jgi:DNA-binding GntR family transcriptional regulator
MSCGHSHLIPLPPVGDQSPTSLLTDELAMDIHLGHLKPGAPLREVEIAEAHGVSRTIVRAALQRLEAQGLAQSEMNKGAKVRASQPETLVDMADLHAGLTAMAAQHAAIRASADDIARIRQYVDMMDHVAEDVGPAEEFQHLRVGFARALFEAAGPVLAERLRTAAPVVPHHDRAMDDVRDGAGQVESSQLSRAVLDAVNARQPEAGAKAAERLVRRHAELVMAFPPMPPVQRKARRAA